MPRKKSLNTTSLAALGESGLHYSPWARASPLGGGRERG